MNPHDPYEIFQRMKGVSPRARYLMFRMLHDGLVDWEGRAWCGGIARLAAVVGYSGGAVSSSLRKLVGLGFLAKEKAVTGGRPVDTYRAGPKLTRRPCRRLSGDGIRQVLSSNEERFKALSASERCLLAQLWLTLQNGGAHMAGVDGYKACTLTGVGVATLAKDAGLGKATAQRLLAGLHQQSFILTSNSDVTADGGAGITKTYFLLGSAMLEKGVTVFRWKIGLEGVLGWLAGDVDDFDVSQLIAEVYGGGVGDERAARLSTGLYCLGEQVLRRYILTCICASVSNGFFWRAGASRTAVLYHIEAALLRALKLHITGPGRWHQGIENMRAEIPNGEAELYDFVAMWAGSLLDKVVAILSLIPRPEVRSIKPPSYLQCHPLVQGGGFFQVDAVYFDISSANNFRAKLEGYLRRADVPVPEIFMGE